MSWHEAEDDSGQNELNIWSVGKSSACIQMAAKGSVLVYLQAETLWSEQGAEVLHCCCGSWCLLKAVQALGLPGDPAQGSFPGLTPGFGALPN